MKVLSEKNEVKEDKEEFDWRRMGEKEYTEYWERKIAEERQKIGWGSRSKLYIFPILISVGGILIVLAIVGFFLLPSKVCGIRIGNICLEYYYPSLALGFWLTLPGILFLVGGIGGIGSIIEKRRK